MCVFARVRLASQVLTWGEGVLLHQVYERGCPNLPAEDFFPLSPFPRYTFNEEEGELPEWFAQDEKQYRRKPLPVDQQAVEEYRQRWREINARPIKKVAEAKARKKRRVSGSRPSIHPPVHRKRMEFFHRPSPFRLLLPTSGKPAEQHLWKRSSFTPPVTLALVTPPLSSVWLVLSASDPQ